MNEAIRSSSSRSCPKRWLALLLALLLALSAGCGEGKAEEEKTLRLGLALYDQQDTFISSLGREVEQLAQEETRRITVRIVDGQGNQSTQNDQIDQMIQSGYDVLFVNLVDRTVAASIIDRAREAGIPVVFFNRQPRRWERVYYVGLEAAQSGRLQAEIVKEAWDRGEADRNGDGKLQYVLLEGEPGHQDALLRSEHSVKHLEELGIPTQKLSSAAANWSRSQGQQQMEGWLDRFGGEIELILANNDDMALGALDACRDRGLEELPLAVGVDATGEALAAMAQGTLTGTVLNDGAGMARSMMDLALALDRGEDPAQTMELEEGHYIWLSYRKVTEKDVEDYLRQQEEEG